MVHGLRQDRDPKNGNSYAENNVRVATLDMGKEGEERSVMEEKQMASKIAQRELEHIAVKKSGKKAMSFKRMDAKCDKSVTMTKGNILQDWLRRCAGETSDNIE